MSPELYSSHCGWLQHVFADLADIADDVRHEAVLGIQAAMHGDHLQLRQLGAMRFDEGQLVRRDVVFQEERLIAAGRQPCA